jgi:hypothetical protein
MTTPHQPSLAPSPPVADRALAGVDGEAKSLFKTHLGDDGDAQLNGHRPSQPGRAGELTDDDGHVVDVDGLIEENAGLRARLDTLPVIEQSKGILMARYQIGPEAAFDLLRRWSSHTNHKLRHLSRLLVDAAARPARARAITGGASVGPSLEEVLSWLHNSSNSGDPLLNRPASRPVPPDTRPCLDPSSSGQLS